MKKALLLFVLSTTYSFAQNRAEILQDAQTGVMNYWKSSFEKYKRTFNEPEFIYINGAYNVYYSSNDNKIITSIDIVKDVFDKYGDAVVYFIYAHEFGHFIQSQTDNFELVSVLREYGADCFAGIYFKKLSDDKRLEKGDYQKIINFIVDNTSKDVKLKEIFSLDSHGSAQGRIKAFNDGFMNNSIKSCLANYSSKQILNR